MDIIKKIVELFSDFFNKYFIVSVCSLLIMIFFKYKTPENSIFIIKLGENWYLFGIYITSFLIILAIIFVYRKISYSVSNYIYKKEKTKEILEKNIENIKKYIDKLSPKSKKVIRFLLDTNNEAIASYDMLFEHNFRDNLIGILDSTEYEIETEGESFIDINNLEPELYQKNSQINLFKLKEEIYDLLKYMVDKGISISKFDNVNKK